VLSCKGGGGNAFAAIWTKENLGGKGRFNDANQAARGPGGDCRGRGKQLIEGQIFDARKRKFTEVWGGESSTLEGYGVRLFRPNPEKTWGFCYSWVRRITETARKS